MKDSTIYGEENIPEDKVKEFNKKAREKDGRLNMELMNEIIEFYNEHYDD